tara:strand:- start:66 stop:182 length:117 start_codon:yes stop_codon:yes gene_type:complete
MEFLEFTFRSFWHFFGVLVLIGAIGAVIPDINIYKNKK